MTAVAVIVIDLPKHALTVDVQSAKIVLFIRIVVGGEADDACVCIAPQSIVQFADPSTSVFNIARPADRIPFASSMVASPNPVMKQGLRDEADQPALCVAVAFNVPLGRCQVAMADEFPNVSE